MEPRARAGRHKSSLNFPEELRYLLYGAGAPAHPDFTHPLPGPSSERYLTNLPTQNRTHPPTSFIHHTRDNRIAEPFPETLRVLDEIVTDYIIETSHAALQVATYAGRAKLKVTDFEFVMKRDSQKLGRVQEMFRRMKNVREARKTAGPGMGADGGVADVGDIRKFQVKDLQDLGDIVGEEGTGKGKGKGRGRRRKRVIEDVDGAQDGEAGGAGAGAGENENAAALENGLGLADADADDLADLDVDLDNDLEAVDEGDKHRSKRARSDID